MNEETPRVDKITMLQQMYPDVLKKREIVVKVLNALDYSNKQRTAVFPSTIIGMYLLEAQKEQRLR